MADGGNTNSVKFSKILDSMKKILNQLTEEFWKEIPTVYKINLNDSLSKSDFELLFASKANQASAGGSVSARKV